MQLATHVPLLGYDKYYPFEQDVQKVAEFTHVAQFELQLMQVEPLT